MRLPDADVQNIEAMLKEYAGVYPKGFSQDNQLRYWLKYKEHFYKEWGERFILEKEISYEISNEQKEDMIWQYKTCGDYPGFTAFLEDLNRTFCSFDFSCAALSEEALAKNQLLYDVIYEEDKAYKKGMKLTRLFQKLAKKHGISGYEDFIKTYSAIINGFKVRGTLHLSIHPMDFLTMGSYLNGWDTCMDLCDGEYKQGTIEMMNSPNVVCAYITHSDKDIDQKSWSWNSKSWRCLFIVENDFLLEIKAYPFNSPSNSQAVMNWLRELYPERKYGEIKESYKRDINDDGWRLPHTETGFMYNDFGCMARGHYYSFSEGIDPDSIHDIICYSGPAICMECGEMISCDSDATDDLARYLKCPNCEGLEVCDNCGEYMSNYHYLADGSQICSHCLEQYTFNSDMSGQNYWDDDKVCVIAVPNKDVTNCSNSNLAYKIYMSTYEFDNLDNYDFRKDIIFKKHLNLTERRYYTNDFIYEKTCYCVDFNDMSENELRYFGIYSSKSFQNVVKRQNEIFS